jgi:Na+/pantothenate symporter
LNSKLRRFVLYYLPLLANIGLIVYLVWQFNFTPYLRRQGEFQIFSVLYAIGGLVVALSGITAFIHAAAYQQGPRALFALALVNTIIPTVLLLAVLQLR